jgi:hypothetical protein
VQTKILMSLFLLFQVSLANLALTGGADGTGSILSANPLPYETLKLSFGLSYYNDVGLRPVSSDGIVGELESGPARMDLGFAVAYGLLPFLETGLHIPYYKDTFANSEAGSSIGDVGLSVKFNYPPYEHSKAFEMSYLLQLTLPTSDLNQKNGFLRNPWYQTRELDGLGNVVVDGEKIVPGDDWSPYGSSDVSIVLRLLNSLNFGEVEGMIPLSLHLGVGLALTDSRHENAFLVNAGVEFWLSPNFALLYSLDAAANVSSHNKHVPLFSFPIAHKVGIAGDIPESGVSLNAGVHLHSNNLDDSEVLANNLPSAYKYYRTPKLGFFGGISYRVSFSPEDTDGDGLIDEWDTCPGSAEDMDGFEDDDGCPEEDNDEDGISDKIDECPNEAEDPDGFNDEDGCPELDNDLDGVPDNLDTCPMEIEDIDNFEDDDGCPDLDNDKDGILDNFDQCKDLPEDKDGFQDEDGCPDKDNDKDGIPDNIDKCPHKAETLNGIKDGDGCPDKKK